jgi:hypothetical protein
MKKNPLKPFYVKLYLITIAITAIKIMAIVLIIGGGGEYY